MYCQETVKHNYNEKIYKFKDKNNLPDCCDFFCVININYFSIRKHLNYLQ